MNPRRRRQARAARAEQKEIEMVKEEKEEIIEKPIETRKELISVSNFVEKIANENSTTEEPDVEKTPTQELPKVTTSSLAASAQTKKRNFAKK